MQERYDLDARPRERRSGALGVGTATLILVASFIAAGGAAADDDPFDRPGFYLAVGGTYQYNAFSSKIEEVIEDEVEDAAPGANANFDLDDSAGLNALVGYRIASFLALEIQYEWVDEYDISGSTDMPVSESGNLYSIEGHALTANTRWIIPFWRIQPYLLLGGGVAVSDVSNGDLANTLNTLGADIDEGTHAKAAGRAGIGLDLYLTKNIVINAQGSVVVTTLKEPDIGDIDDLNYMSIAAGLQYRF